MCSRQHMATPPMATPPTQSSPVTLADWSDSPAFCDTAQGALVMRSDTFNHKQGLWLQIQTYITKQRHSNFLKNQYLLMLWIYATFCNVIFFSPWKPHWVTHSGFSYNRMWSNHCLVVHKKWTAGAECCFQAEPTLSSARSLSLLSSSWMGNSARVILKVWHNLSVAMNDWQKQ